MSRTHSFTVSRDESLRHSHRDRFRSFYHSIPFVIPTETGLLCPSLTIKWFDDDREKQNRGIDCGLFHGDKTVALIDEKIRPIRNGELGYGDCLVEYLSDIDRCVPGWAVDPDKDCDYVAYAIEARSLVWLLKADLLRIAATDHEGQWTKRFGVRDVPNQEAGRRWITRNVPVPWREICAAINCREEDIRYEW